MECLRGEGAPPPAVRAVVHAALHYVDAELLNALVLRRDCCSISAIKALQVTSHCTATVCTWRVTLQCCCYGRAHHVNIGVAADQACVALIRPIVTLTPNCACSFGVPNCFIDKTAGVLCAMVCMSARLVACWCQTHLACQAFCWQLHLLHSRSMPLRFVRCPMCRAV